MTMPWTMGALLPAEQRYTNMKFRRVARRFEAHRLDYADAAELCAFMDTVGHKASRWIFGWDPPTLVEAKRLLKHIQQFPDHAVRVSENNAEPSREDGLAVLRAMQEGGWRQTGVPPVVRLAVLDMRDAGMSLPAIGRELGLTVDQLHVICHGLWRNRQRSPRSAGVGLLVAQSGSFLGES